MSKKIDKIIIGDYVFDTLVALTLEDQQKGLMFKPWPPPIMSFPYDSLGVRKFWMKNTSSPLDILFCCNGQIIDICHGKPNDCTLLGPNLPIDLVVELPLGTANNFNIKIGTKIKLNYTLNTFKKKIFK